MTKRKTIIIATLITCMLTGCHMNHEWQEATCTAPKTCSVGNETEGDALGHTWVDASCTEPKHCSVCGETEGEALEHTWVDASCAEPKHCSVCGETEGNTLDHILTEANYQQPATCEVCGETVGEPLQAYYEKNNLSCDAELNKAYSSVLLCSENPNYVTTANVTFSDYKTFVSDETHEALEGYEWKTITITFVCDDDNANNYGVYTNLHTSDYYSDEFVDYEFGENYTINYNGIDYNECLLDYKNEDGWTEQVFTSRYIFTMRVPEGYAGLVVGTASDATDLTGENIIWDIDFRLQ